MNWTHGYAADTEYTSHYFAELAPMHLDLMALTAGVLPPERQDGRFRYCELGCGNGMTTNLIAACNPNAEFVAIDFMPVHVANARRAARRGGLNNAQFLEMSFARACEENFEPFDYIVAHGVYSWISAENRAEMVKFFNRFLAPGGLVYLSYNTYPGWLPISPVQKLVSEYARTIPGSSPKRVAGGFEFAANLLSKNALALTSQPNARIQIEKAPSQAPNYLAQEYLNADWHPLYVTDVMRELSAAKLDYVASATAAENDFRFLVDEATAGLIRDQPTEELRQLVKDMSINARFRRDIYTRGGRRLSGLDQRQMLSARHIALTRSPATISYNCEYNGRTIGYDTPAARKLIAVLETRPHTLGELAAEMQSAGAKDGLRLAIELALVLIISGVAIPVEVQKIDTQPMNASLTAQALEDTACNALATSWGNPVQVSPLELALLAVAEPNDTIEGIVTKVLALAKRKGRLFNKAGAALRTDAEAVEFLTKEYQESARIRLPALAQLGLVSVPAG